MVLESGKSPNHRPVVGKQSVAMEFVEIGKAEFEVIQGIRAFGMSGQLHPLPGGKVGEDLASGFLDLGLDLRDLTLEAHAECRGLRLSPEFFQLALEFHDRFLEVEVMLHANGVRQPANVWGQSSFASGRVQWGIAARLGRKKGLEIQSPAQW